MHAPDAVVTAFRHSADAAIHEIGSQMAAVWSTAPIAAPTDVPLGSGYERTSADAKRTILVAAMTADLNAIGTWWRVTR